MSEANHTPDLFGQNEMPFNLSGEAIEVTQFEAPDTRSDEEREKDAGQEFMPDLGDDASEFLAALNGQVVMTPEGEGLLNITRETPVITGRAPVKFARSGVGYVRYFLPREISQIENPWENPARIHSRNIRKAEEEYADNQDRARKGEA